MTLQQEAYHLLCDLPEENIRLIIELIRKMMPVQKVLSDGVAENESAGAEISRKAFKKLESARLKADRYYGDNFDINREIEEAMEEKYGHFA